MTAVHVIMATHNRRRVTQRCLLALKETAAQASASIRLTVFDDGSTDDTPLAIREIFPEATILHGSGDYFWARSMATAERVAMHGLRPSEYLMWLNDDTMLDRTALSLMLSQSGSSLGRIVVANCRDPETGVHTYGGLRKSGWHPLSFKPIHQSGEDVKVSTFNGNAVLIPCSVAHALGGLDGGFSHALADIDYGLRADAAGFKIVCTPQAVASCRLNPQVATNTMEAWRRFTGVKGGGNLRSLIRFMTRHAPLKMPLAIGSTYLLWWLRRAASKW